MQFGVGFDFILHSHILFTIVLYLCICVFVHEHFLLPFGVNNNYYYDNYNNYNNNYYYYWRLNHSP